MSKKATQVLIIIFLAYFAIIHSPIVEVFNNVKIIAGIPALLFFFLIFWISMVLIMLYLTSRKTDDNDYGS